MVVMLAVGLGFGTVGTGMAAAGAPKKPDVSANVTDPQNLLGGDVSRVDDAISSVKEETGVSVRLLYLANFTGTKNPDKWAGDVLQSTNPPANTVLLAVASNDGRLVVAVSHNSDNWLKDKDHVSELSQAALGPLQKGDNPDWSGSACAMMDEIKTLHRQEASKKPKIIIGVAGAVAVVVLVAIAVLLLRRKRKSKSAGVEGSGEGEKNVGKTGADSGLAGKPRKGKAKGPRHRKKH